MGVHMPNKPFTWSWSSLELFEKDKVEWHRRYVLREKDEPTPALLRGREVHKELENYMNGTAGSFLPMARPVWEAIQGKEHYIEWKLGITKDMEPCEFFAKDVWGRCAIDVAIVKNDTIAIIDWKTGKKREVPYHGQLEVCAWFAFIRMPRIIKAVAFNIYVDQGKKSDTLEYSSEGSRAELLARIDKMEKYYNSFA